MKNILFTLLIIIASVFNLMSQISVYWIGGHPGKSRDWNTSSNWSNSKVPNEFSDVTIPYKESNLECYPEIQNGSFKIHSLNIQKGTSLLIHKNANLTIAHKASMELLIDQIDIKGSIQLLYLKYKDIAFY